MHLARVAKSAGEEIRAGCMAHALRKAARAASRVYDEALTPLDLGIGQLSTLAALDRAEPLSIGELAESLGIDRTTLNRNLEPLQRRHFVGSSPSRHDTRIREVTLTRAGRETLRAALPLWRKAQATTRARVPGWAALRESLELFESVDEP